MVCSILKFGKGHCLEKATVWKKPWAISRHGLLAETKLRPPPPPPPLNISNFPPDPKSWPTEGNFHFWNCIKDSYQDYSCSYVCILFLCRSPSDGWRMAKVFALIFLILSLVATAMMNFSLAVVMVMILIPPSLWVEPLGE